MMCLIMGVAGGALCTSAYFKAEKLNALSTQNQYQIDVVKAQLDAAKRVRESSNKLTKTLREAVDAELVAPKPAPEAPPAKAAPPALAGLIPVERVLLVFQMLREAPELRDLCIRVAYDGEFSDADFALVCDVYQLSKTFSEHAAPLSDAEFDDVRNRLMATSPAIGPFGRVRVGVWRPHVGQRTTVINREPMSPPE